MCTNDGQFFTNIQILAASNSRGIFGEMASSTKTVFEGKNSSPERLVPYDYSISILSEHSTKLFYCNAGSSSLKDVFVVRW